MSDKMREALEDARLQLEYVQEKHGYATGETILARIRAALAEAPPSRPGTAGAEDSRVYFICQSCETENPEGAVSCRSDIAVMPDGTWLCSGCYSDCEKTAYGLVANDIDDFEFPRFEDLPRPAAYPADPTVSPQTRGAARQFEDLKLAAETFRAAMITSGAINHVGQDQYFEELRALERALNPLNYRDASLPRAERKPDICTFPACGPNCSGRKG